MALDDDAEFYALVERGQIQDAVDGFVESALGLDYVVVKGGFRSINRDADHDVAEAYLRIPASETRVREAPPVRQEMQRTGQAAVFSAVLKEVDQCVAVQGRLPASQARHCALMAAGG